MVPTTAPGCTASTPWWRSKEQLLTLKGRWPESVWTLAIRPHVVPGSGSIPNLSRLRLHGCRRGEEQ